MPKSTFLGRPMQMFALVCLLNATAVMHAADIFWTGPIFTNVHASFSSAVDKLTTNHVSADATNNVWLTRGTQFPLYNAAAESGWNGLTPANTKWALASGPLTSAASLSYSNFYDVVGHPLGSSPGLSVGKTFYVKIVTDNIYLSLKLTAWGNNNGGSFTYERSTPAIAVAPTPTISLTNPAGGTVFAAPANVNLGANAAVSSGTVTNVQFLTNGASLKSVQAPPFAITATNLAAGAYALTAVATAAGISATSTVVNISVVTPVAVSLGNTAKPSGTNFQFSYPANVGLSYVVEVSTNLAAANWIRIATNTAASNPVVFVDTHATNAPGFYRVGRLPNP